ncbi:uncharacterized protein JCM15063_006443 [Sporobolomyces koalae]|uniref:uncharacterized protein n=1 Tax=Sporobolomyces koalae TaxID=500713 RepID=UPI00316E3975
MLHYIRLVSLVVALGLLASGDASPVPASAIITTSKGPVQGYSGSAGNRYTIPYGKSPVGPLRFKRPEAVASFNGTYDGSKLPKACLQQDSPNTPSDQSEDCLYMNIFTPKQAQPDSKLPVFVWVHGGSFLTGSTKDLDGFALANSQNMIVVTVQYRLGYFGWLKYDPWGVEGNMGLRDLILALETIQHDIGAFGGDASLVSLAGQSSGAQMVKALLSTPSASNLFHRAILHSAPLDYSPQPSEIANTVGSAFLFDIAKCSKLKTACLWRLKQPSEFFQAQGQLAIAAQQGTFGSRVSFAEPFNIVADGDLVQGDGQQVINSGKEIIFTTVKDEGCPGVAAALESIPPGYPTESLIQAFYGDRAEAIIESGLYTDESVSQFDSLTQLATDLYWTCPNQQFARAAASQSTVYLGEFELGIQASTSARFEQCRNKVGHEDDIAVVFGTGASTAAQQALVREVQTRWGSFAKSGNPNSGTYPQWPTVSNGNGQLEVLQLGKTESGESQVGPSQRIQACELYNSF